MYSEKSVSSTKGNCAKIRASFLVIFLVCIACSVQKEIRKSDWETLNLNGKIKSIRQIPRHIQTKFGKYLIGEPWPYVEENFVLLFDESGKLVEKRLFYNNGTKYSREMYYYNEDGNRYKEVLYNQNGSLGSRITYVFDRKGRITQSDCHNYLGVNYIYKYDNRGNRVEAHKYYGDGNLYFKATYAYNKKGNRIEEQIFTSEGKLFSKWKYQYDESGNRIIKERYLPNDRPDCKLVYKYDENHNKTHWKHFGSDGQLISEGTYVYEYDSHGNWTKKTKMENSEPIYILKREIEYFE